MDGIFTNLKNRFAEGDMLTKLLFINVGVFLFVRLVDVLFLLFFNHSFSFWMRYLEFPSSPRMFLTQPWSLLTYMFLHFDVLHILFNLLWLYWFGKLFVNYFDSRRLCGVYLLGGMFGALLFLAAYNLFPYYTSSMYDSYLLGASASVMAVVFGVSFYAKEEEVMLFLFGRIKIYYLALLTLLLDLLSITSGNAGGHLAHIGGALFGIWFAVQMRKGKDLTRPFNRLMDKLVDMFSRKPKMKVTYKRTETDYEYNERKQREMADIDRILDKLKKSGYQSLSSEEKKQLFDASKK